eukprot:8473149-Alexandrium_andersonii.AAC.1
MAAVSYFTLLPGLFLPEGRGPSGTAALARRTCGLVAPLVLLARGRSLRALAGRLLPRPLRALGKSLFSPSGLGEVVGFC